MIRAQRGYFVNIAFFGSFAPSWRNHRKSPDWQWRYSCHLVYCWRRSTYRYQWNHHLKAHRLFSRFMVATFTHYHPVPYQRLHRPCLVFLTMAYLLDSRARTAHFLRFPVKRHPGCVIYFCYSRSECVVALNYQIHHCLRTHQGFTVHHCRHQTAADQRLHYFLDRLACSHRHHHTQWHSGGQDYWLYFVD